MKKRLFAAFLFLSVLAAQPVFAQLNKSINRGGPVNPPAQVSSVIHEYVNYNIDWKDVDGNWITWHNTFLGKGVWMVVFIWGSPSGEVMGTLTLIITNKGEYQEYVE